jgi:holo-[acyl-carrier protein] synthase
MVTGHGVDLIEVERIKNALSKFGDRFLKRTFDAQEVAEALRLRDPSQYYASRFAAKEAFSKAVGTGFVGFGMRDVIVLRDAGKPPRLEFSPKLRQKFPGLKPEDFLLSLSHVRDLAMASVIRVS